MAGRLYKERQARARVQGLLGAVVRRALYLRVSTEDQAERGTIAAQEHVLRSTTEAENQGRELSGLPPIVIVGVYKDEASPGPCPWRIARTAVACSRTPRRAPWTKSRCTAWTAWPGTSR